MHFLTETPFIVGIIATVLGLFIMFFIFKPNKNELIGIKNWNTRDNWQGVTVTTEAKSWSQTETKYGNDFFYDFSVLLVVDGKEKTFTGKGLVRANDIHKLKKGIKVIVKYNEDRPPKIAIIDVLY